MRVGASSFRPLQRPGVISTVYGRMFRRFAGRNLHTLPIDDIIVSSKSFEEHLDHVKTVLQRLCAHEVKLKAKKCNFFRKDRRFATLEESSPKEAIGSIPNTFML